MELNGILALMERWNLKMFYDGACPLCSREIAFIKSRNKREAIVFEDTSAPGFDPKKYGISSDPGRMIHGILPDGTIVRGLEVFRRAYREIGFGWLLAPTGWPILKPIFDLLYLLFAKNGMKISRLLGRRCDDESCLTK